MSPAETTRLARLRGYAKTRRWVVLGFGLSRLLVWVVGVRFDSSWFEIAPQYIDEQLLRHRLLESTFYLHTQPPLLNLSLGLLLKLSPFSLSTTLWLGWLAGGALMALMLFDLGRILGLGPRGATAAALIIVCSPSVILVENNAMYDQPVTVLVVFTIWAFARYVSRPTTGRFVVIVLSVGALVLCRPLFHPVWYLLAVGATIAFRRPPLPTARLVGLAVLPLLVIGAVLVKNQIVFDSPSLSSWFGMNVARVTVEQIPPEERSRLVQEGVLNPTARVPAFSSYDKLAGVGPPCVPHHPDVPVLSTSEKSGGDPNMNDECLLPIYRLYADNARIGAQREPARAARSVALAGQMFFMPVALGPFYNSNSRHLDGYDTLWSIGKGVVRLPVPDGFQALNGLRNPDGTLEFGLVDLAAFLFAIAAGARSLWRVAHRPRPRLREAAPVDALRLSVAVVALYTFAVGTLLEVGENYRFRFQIEPLVMVVALAALGCWWRDRRAVDVTGSSPVPADAR